ncbi:MAG TPA: GAF domain-containing sensor histidine kinase [Candidatus Omnitrophota bacterium]|nr:GAF domain-containing sensor histidine kinase [Candidatus Omnitrophota bacterium]HRZ14411.1 GAF domain-containing sensor histidine kinase [Candidatus Omnitrophota bacterium]
MTVCQNNDVGALVRGFLNGTLKELIARLNAECGSLFVFDPDNEELVLDSFYNSVNLRIKGHRQRIGEGVAGTVGRINRPVLVKDIAKDSRFKRNGFTHYHTGSFISIPLCVDTDLIGIINIGDKSNAAAFSEADFEFAKLMCAYASRIVADLMHLGDQRRQQLELHRQQSELEKFASVGKLASGIVEAIESPLRHACRLADAFLRVVSPSSVMKEYMLEIKSGLNRIGTIAHSLRSCGMQLLSGGRAAARVPIDVHKLLEECLDVFSGRLNPGYRIIRQYQDSLPLVIDQGLSHVFTNIIKNALDAMSTGGTLEIVTWNDKGGVRIAFRDSGPGMCESVRKNLFEPFFTTKSIGKGTGLGLAICREIMHGYSSAISVESAPGEGSVFEVFIPPSFCVFNAGAILTAAVQTR